VGKFLENGQLKSANEKDNITTDLSEIYFEDGRWKELAQDRVQGDGFDISGNEPLGSATRVS
jgi:hypothetical protein